MGATKVRRDARKRVVTFLGLTLLFTAVSASLLIGIGTGGNAGESRPGCVWSPGLAALVTVFSFQRNVKGIGWRLGRHATSSSATDLPLAECSLVYGVVRALELGVLPLQPAPCSDSRGRCTYRSTDWRWT